MSVTRPSSAGWLRRLTLAAVVGATFWFAGHRIADGASSLDRATLIGQAPLLALVLVTLAAATLVLGASWIVLLEDVTPGRPHRRGQLMIAFTYAWLGRYLPGGVSFVAGKVFLGRRVGYATSPLVVAAGVQSVLEVLVATIFGATLVAASLGPTSASAAYAALVLFPSLGLAMLHPAVLRRIIDRARGLMERDPLPADNLPGQRALLGASVLVAANQLLNGLALLGLLHVVGGVTPETALLAIGALSLSGVAGILVVVAPAGLGVRDGALTGLLATRIAVDAAALAAVMVRATTVFADLALVGLVFGADMLSGRRLALRVLRGQDSAYAPHITRSAPLGDERPA